MTQATDETMTVIVRDAAVEAASWGSGPFSPALTTVTISACCPVCAGRRGAPANRRQHEDGVWFQVSVWQNPCGHLDMYSAVIKEAAIREAYQAKRPAS